MAAYNNFIITNQGIEILKGLMNGNGSMEFRCLAVGSGYYDPEKNIEEIRAMEGLKEERQRVMFSSIGKSEEGFVNLKANLTNKDLEEGYPMTEAGIYVGKKGEDEEILYCVSIVDNPDYMPDYSSKQIYNVIYKMTISIGDVLNPTISYKTDIYALAEDLQEEVRRAATAENELQERKLDVGGDASGTTVNFLPAEQLEPLQSGGEQRKLFGQLAKAITDFSAHLEDRLNPHDGTKEQIGLGNVDNTSDMDKPVSVAQQAALEEQYAQLTAYTLQKIADLINGAPSTLDTLGEIAQAMSDNESVVEALNEAVGKKASAVEFDSHVRDNTAHTTPEERDSWTHKVDLSMLASYLSLAGGTMRGTINSTHVEPAINRRYSIGSSSKRYSDVWASSINTVSVRSPIDDNGLYLESSNGAIEICPDVSDYIRVIVENIDDGNGNINGALYAIGSRYPEYKETWLGTSDHPWDNVFTSKINSKPIPACSISGTTLYINF